MRAMRQAKTEAMNKAKMEAIAGTQAMSMANGALTLRLQCWIVLLRCLQAMVQWFWICQPMILCTSSCFCYIFVGA